MANKNRIIIVVIFLLFAANCLGREVIKEITENTKLNGNLVYYVDEPPLLIHGPNMPIKVIVPAGTTFIIKEDFNVPAIKIYDQASVWFGLRNGMTEPNDIPRQDDANVLIPPVRIIGASRNPFTNNYYGILVERTASSACFFNNIILQGFYFGMVVDKPLDFPYTSLYITDCWNGIQSYGSTKIMNGYVKNYGLDIDPCYTGYAYECFSTSKDGSVVYEDAEFILYRCLADDGGYAFNYHGAYTSSMFYAYDCAATNNYSAFNIWDGYGDYLIVLCPGLYNNTLEKNDPWIYLDSPVYASSSPMVIKPDDHRIFLNPDSNFVDMGSRVTYNSGWTTRTDGMPDNDLGDIWPSYQTKSWSGLKADIDNDGIVDINDLFFILWSWCQTNKERKADLDMSGAVDAYDAYIMFNHWLFEDSPVANISDGPVIDFKDFAALAGFWKNGMDEPITAPIDLNADGVCNFIDFSILAQEWYSVEDTNIQILNLDDPNGNSLIQDQIVCGNIGVLISNPPPLTTQFSVYVDNIMIGTYTAEVNTSQYWIPIPTESLCNGWHDIKVATFESSGEHTNYKPIKLSFNNLITHIDVNDHFVPGSPMRVSGFYDGYDQLKVEVKSDDSVLWSQMLPAGENINIEIPGSAFAGQMFAEIVIEPIGTLMAADTTAASSPDAYTKAITKKFKIEDYNSIRVVMLLPDSFITGKFLPAINAWLTCFEQRGISLERVAILSLTDVTYENMNLAIKSGGRKYVFYFGHANSFAGTTQRTFIQAWSRQKVPCGHLTPICLWPTYYMGQTFAFSYTRRRVGDAEPLPGNWDYEGIDLDYLNLINSNKVEQMWVFGCHSAEFPDMAYTFGMYWGCLPYQDMLYMGFRETILGSSYNVLDTVIKGVVSGSVTIAENMAMGRSIFDSVNAIQSYSSRKAYFGTDGVWNYDNPSSDDNFFMYGCGNPGNMRIQP